MSLLFKMKCSNNDNGCRRCCCSYAYVHIYQFVANILQILNSNSKKCAMANFMSMVHFNTETLLEIIHWSINTQAATEIQWSHFKSDKFFIQNWHRIVERSLESHNAFLWIINSFARIRYDTIDSKRQAKLSKSLLDITDVRVSFIQSWLND